MGWVRAMTAISGVSSSTLHVSHATANNTPPADVTQLSNTQIAALNATQISRLTETNVHALSSAQMAAISTKALAGFNTTQTGFLSATQVAAFTTTQIAALSSTTSGGLSAADINALSTSQIAAIGANGAKGLKGTTIAALANTQIAALNTTAIKNLSATQLNALNATQIGAITANQLHSITSAQVNGLGDAQLSAITLSALTNAQLGGVSGTLASRISTDQLDALSTTQIGALSTTAAGALTTTQVASLSSTQVNAMKALTIGDEGGLRIDLIWGSSASKAPSAFRAAVIEAAKSFTDSYTNNALINIQVGYGETNGKKVGSSAVAQSQSKGSFVTYATLRNALLANSGNSDVQATADATLASKDPTNGGKFMMTTAQQKALGLVASNGSAIDGYVGLSTALSMDYTHSGVAGKFDAVGAIQHEISEVLGRMGSVGKAFGAKVYTALDLFRYKETGAGASRSLTAGPTADYFSIDGGATNLGHFNAATGSEDFGDWNEGGDAYGYGAPGVVGDTPARDVAVMAAIGYNLSVSALGAVSNIVA
ncbi:MAG: NF038122 family metalloprotease [Pseudomonadota bacterium]